MTGILSVSKTIPETMQDPVNGYISLIRETAGETVKELAFFGAIVAGSFDIARHTARNVLVVAEVDLSMLKRLGTHGPSLGRLGVSAPLVMTPRYIEASLDTFPLEFIEIRQAHCTVIGTSHFTELTFEDAHVRLQCEREIKTLLIGLRQGLLASAGVDRFVGALERDVGEALLRTLRGMLWLKGIREFRESDGVIDEIEKTTHRRLEGVRAALDPTGTHGWGQFETLYCDIEQLGDVVDGW